MRRLPRRVERGDAVVETVLVVPVLLFLVMAIVQAALWFHGSQVVEAAAQEAVNRGRVEGGTAGGAASRARELVDDVAPSLSPSLRVRVVRTAMVTEVTVEGSVQPVIPGVSLSVRGRAEGPTERFREDR